MITIEQVRRRVEDDAKSMGYSLNYDEPFLADLLAGLKTNEERFGYPSCPCRIASGNFELDRDIICPCDYRDPDVLEFGACYCALFIRTEMAKKRSPIPPVPERRPEAKQARVMEYKTGGMKEKGTVTPQPAAGKAPSPGEKPEVIPYDTAEGGPTGKRMWYCKQCGYVVFRDEPPYICPICKARRELFSEIRFDAKGAG